MVERNSKKYYGHPEFYKILDGLAQLHSDKNSDYASEERPLGNFERVGRWIQEYELWKLARDRPALFTCLVYSLKQIDAVFDMLGKNKTAKIEDPSKKMDDIIVYTIIAKILYGEGK